MSSWKCFHLPWINAAMRRARALWQTQIWLYLIYFNNSLRNFSCCIGSNPMNFVPRSSQSAIDFCLVIFICLLFFWLHKCTTIPQFYGHKKFIRIENTPAIPHWLYKLINVYMRMSVWLLFFWSYWTYTYIQIVELFDDCCKFMNENENINRLISQSALYNQIKLLWHLAKN